MKYKFYTKSVKAWSAMLEAVKQAEKLIYLESFILTDDALTHEFFETLKQKARSGVSVKIIVDKIGSLWAGSVNKKELESAGAEVLLFNHWWLNRTHRKILIVDDQTAFIGGVNISGNYARWLDLQVMVTGWIIPRLLSSFSRVYYLAGGRDPSVLALKKWRFDKTRSALHRAKLWLLERWPIRGKSVLRSYYRRKISEAKRKIVIVTPYFVPHRWLIKALTAAIKRNVEVEVLMPKETDVWLTDIANYLFADALKSSDFKFFLTPEMIHAKVLLIDDREGLVGSNNIDALSFDLNLEAGIFFKRKDMILDLRKIIDGWKNSATPLDSSRWHGRWYYRFLGWLVKILRPIL